MFFVEQQGEGEAVGVEGTGFVEALEQQDEVEGAGAGAAFAEQHDEVVGSGVAFEEQHEVTDEEVGFDIKAFWVRE